MERYNFQINDPTDWKDWDKIAVRTRYFKQREQAVSLSRRIAKRYNTEVRLTTGTNPLKASGTYIRG